MMKLAPLAVIAASCATAIAAADAEVRSVDMTTEGLEKSTQQFIESNSITTRSPQRRLQMIGGSLRKKGTRKKNRKGRGAKGGKMPMPDHDDWNMMPDHDDWNMKPSSPDRKPGLGHWKYDDDDDYWWGGGSGKSGKSGRGGYSGKSGKWGSGPGFPDDDDWDGPGWGHEELFYILPTACPGHCISSHVTHDTHEMIDSLKECKDHDETQMWMVSSDGSYVMVESYYEEDMCIGVDYSHGDTEEELAEACHNGELVLKDCDSEYGTEWYFTGGQLISSLCWAAGLSTMMTVFLDDSGNNNKDEIQTCLPDVAVWGENDEAVLKSDTFMFVNRLPEAPFHIDAEDVNDYIDGKGNNKLDVTGIEGAT